MTLRTVAHGLRTHLPGVAWRARNTFELLRWSGGRVFGRRRDAAYGAEFWNLHDSGDWSGFATLVVARFQPRSVVDIGCGDGKLLSALQAVAPEVRLAGYDGSRAAVERARARGIAVEQADLAFAGRRTYRDLVNRVAGTDVAVCLETAEHLPWWSATGLVRVLGGASVVIFSAAQPNQGGTEHMNERPPAYWRRRFEAVGLVRHPLESDLRSDVERLNLPWWYGANLQLFRRRR